MTELTSEQQEQAEELFEKVFDLDPDSRQDFLDSSDAAPAVRAEVESLLAFHPTAREKLESPLVTPDAVVQAVNELVADDSGTPLPVPTTIGPYRIIERIGEGGMGTVYLAEQEKPLRRRVALKLIKLGMDTRGVIARFEAERQALALMNHPHVARALDAGSTESGRPYFVMEYVDGVRITEYCDEHRLDLPARLMLFRRVCEAIQHAHQKGVIHRDIKPSNVLVCAENGQAVPKVIDFGVAKATNQHLTEQTLFTEHGVLIGTPEYMSPEQAGSNGSDVDTRSDVYSLGVLLYELLVGALPIDTETLRRASLEELHRLIRDQEPPKPTTRLSSLGADAANRARNRGTDVTSLRRTLSGDLDWIVMKCLEKDRDRRYAATAELIDDLEHYLHHRPVSAGPPSVRYRMRKFARRNRGFIAAASIVFVVLTAGIVSTITYAVAESRQRAVAETQAEIATAVNAFLDDMLASVDPRNAGPDVTVRHVLDAAAERVETELADHPAVERDVRATIGRSYVALGLFDEALPHHDRALALAVELYGRQSEESAASRNELGFTLKQLGRFADAEDLHRRALATDLELFGEMDLRVAASMNHLAQSLYDQGKYDEGRPLYERAYQIRSSLLDENDFSFITSLNNLARERYTAGEYAEAQELQQEAYRVMAALFGENHVDTVGQMCNVAFLAMTRGQYEEAERMFRDGLDRYRELHGGSHPDVARTLNNLAECVRRQGRYEEAVSLQREALAMRRETLGVGHPLVAKSLNSLALALTSLKRYDEAADLHAQALAIRRQQLGDKHPDVANSLNNLAFTLYKQEQYERAEALFRKALDIRRSAFGDDHPQVANTQMNLARCLCDMNELEEAESLCRSALSIQIERLGAQHPHLAAIKHVLGRVLTRADRYEEAETWLLAALEQLRTKFGDRSPHLQGIIEDLVALYESSGQTALANRYRLELEGYAPP